MLWLNTVLSTFEAAVMVNVVWPRGVPPLLATLPLTLLQPMPEAASVPRRSTSRKRRWRWLEKMRARLAGYQKDLAAVEGQVAQFAAAPIGGKPRDLNLAACKP